MKIKGQCPKCGSVELWHVAEVAANEDTGSLQAQPTFRLAVTGNGRQGRAGRLEAYACQRCGFVELYLTEPLKADGVRVRAVRRPVP